MTRVAICLATQSSSDESNRVRAASDESLKTRNSSNDSVIIGLLMRRGRNTHDIGVLSDDLSGVIVALLSEKHIRYIHLFTLRLTSCLISTFDCTFSHESNEVRKHRESR